MHVNYLAPATGEALLAKARAIQVGSTVGVAHVDVMTVINGAEHARAVALVTLRAVDVDGRTKNPSA
jgi:acyl-coenzyme A thioesterase PaaI-like protein